MITRRQQHSRRGLTCSSNFFSKGHWVGLSHTTGDTSCLKSIPCPIIVVTNRFFQLLYIRRRLHILFALRSLLQFSRTRANASSSSYSSFSQCMHFTQTVTRNSIFITSVCVCPVSLRVCTDVYSV